MTQRYLAVTFIQDTVLGLFTFAAGLQCSLPEAEARGLSPQYLTISGPGTVDQRLNVSALGVDVGALQSELDSLASEFTALQTAVDADITTINTTVAALQASETRIDDTVAGLVGDDTADNWSLLDAAWRPGGAFVTAGKSQGRITQPGDYKVNGLLILDRRLSFPMNVRGAVRLRPGNNLPAVDASGADAAFIKYAADAPDANSNVAFSTVLGGFNIDFSGSSQTNPINGLHWMNPDPSKNSHDGDPDFDSKKKYVTGLVHDMDIVGATGHGVVTDAGEGRAEFRSVRALNGYFHGFTLGSNDITAYGHCGAGGNGKSGTGAGLHVGNAAGYYGILWNLWGVDGPLRNAATPALFIDQRSYFVHAISEHNDMCRFNGGAGYDAGGLFVSNMLHQHAVNFASDGVGYDSSGTNDPRCQANINVTEYQSVDFLWNHHVRTDAGGSRGTFTADATTNKLTSTNHGLSNNDNVWVLSSNTNPHTLPAPLLPWTAYFVVNKTANDFQLSLTMGGLVIDLTTTGSGTHTWATFITPGNFGGDLTCLHGTAPQRLIDASTGGATNAMTNVAEAFTTSPNVRPWTDIGHAVTITQGSPAVFTLTAHNLRDNHRIFLRSTGLLPAPLRTDDTLYWVKRLDANTFNVSLAPFTTSTPTLVNTTDTGTGGALHWLWSQSTLPYAQNHGNQLNFLYQDAYRCLVRSGALGPVPDHFAFGICNLDDINDKYRGELGDRTADPRYGISSRYGMYGIWEFASAITYRDEATSAHTYSATDPITGTTFTSTIQAGTRLQRILLTDGAFTTGTLQLPTGVDINASQDLRIVIRSQTCAQLLYTFSQAGGGFVGSGITAPAWVPAGGLVIDLQYERTMDKWAVTNFRTDGGMPGRIDGVAVPTGVIGEYQRQFVAVASAVALTSGVSKTVTSMTLTPGVYDITAVPGFNATSATGVTTTQWAINTTTDTLPGTKDESYGSRQYASTSVNSIFATETCFKRVTLSATTTFYMVQSAAFTGGAVSGYGTMFWRRTG